MVEGDRYVIENINVTLGSNIALQLLPASLAEKDLNKIDIPYYYPPLKAKVRLY